MVPESMFCNLQILFTERVDSILDPLVEMRVFLNGLLMLLTLSVSDLLCDGQELLQHAACGVPC